MSNLVLAPPADAAVNRRGVVNIGAQTFAGNKSFIGEVVALAGVRFADNTLLTSALLPNGSVTLAQMANLATQTLIGRSTAGTGAPEAITVGAGLTLSGGVLSSTGGGSVSSVSVVTANGVSGSVANPTTTPAITLTLGAITPTSVAASGTVTGSNISGTNTGDQTITLTGDVTGTGTGSFATTISSGAVSLGKLADIATQTLLGRSTAGTGPVETITLGAGLSLSGGVLSSPDAGGTVTDVSVVTANGVSGSVANSTTTPAITLDLGDISPTSVETPTVFNTNGTGASDVTLTLGTTVADASVHATAKLSSFRAGIGGTEVESMAVFKGGILGKSTSTSRVVFDDTNGAKFITKDGLSGLYFNSSNQFELTGAGIYLSSITGLAQFQNQSGKIVSNLGAGSSDTAILVGTEATAASTSNTARVLAVVTSGSGTPENQHSFYKNGRSESTPSANHRVATYTWRGDSTNEFAKTLYLDDSALQLVLANNSAMTFTLQVVARNNVDGVSKGWKIEGVIQRNASAATTSMTMTSTSTFQTDAVADAWSCDPSADATNGALKISVTGSAAKTIRWLVKGDITEVTF